MLVIFGKMRAFEGLSKFKSQCGLGSGLKGFLLEWPGRLLRLSKHNRVGDLKTRCLK